MLYYTIHKMTHYNCYHTIKLYITDNKYDECFKLFENTRNHMIIYSKRIPHKLIIELLQTAVNNNHIHLVSEVVEYIRIFKPNYYVEYSKIFNEACKGFIDIVKLFLNHQYIFYPHFKNNTPLKSAIQHNQLEIAQLLMKNKKVIDKLCPDMLYSFYINNDAYKYFIGHNTNKNMRNEGALIRAINSNDNDSANIILNSNIVYDINIGKESIMRAAMYRNNLEIVKKLLTYKDKPKMELLNCGFTHACFGGNITIIEYILENSIIKDFNMRYVNSICFRLFTFMCVSPIPAKIISLLVKYDIINNKLIAYTKKHKSDEHYLEKIAGFWKLKLNYKYQVDYTLYSLGDREPIKLDHLLDQLLDTYRYYIMKNSGYREAICIFLQNKKLNKCYDQSVLLLSSKVELFEQYGIPGDVINMIVGNMHNLLVNEYMKV